MMRQWHEIKRAFPDALLFFRLGDFYELFYEDAEVGARELDITLTGRDAGAEGRVPMCGVPYHSVEQYLSRLVARGYKVAICEQVEDPKSAKGLVERRVVRVVTPGSRIEDSLLDARANVYMASVARARQRGRTAWGVALADVSTGELICADAGDNPWELLSAWDVAEVVLPESLAGEDAEAGARALGASVTRWPDRHFDPGHATEFLCRHFGTITLAGFGVPDRSPEAAAAGALLAYVEHTLQGRASQTTELRRWEGEDALRLDPATRRNLEIRQRLDGSFHGSLLWAIDFTMTPLGARLLRRWLDFPLRDRRVIEARLEAVSALVEDGTARAAIRAALRGVQDVERLVARVATGRATPRDLAALRESLRASERVLQAAGPAVAGLLAEHADALQPPRDVLDRLETILTERPPVSVSDGGVVREGVSAELDELRALQRDSRATLARMEQRERERTGIRSLKIGYNKVFGYYIEVTHANRDAVPADYVRKQTLANAERYVTGELKELEDRLLHAAERALQLEAEIFRDLCASVAARVAALQRLAHALGVFDVVAGFAELAAARGYVRPAICEEPVLEAAALRHPVVEALLGPGRYVPNDVRMDADRRFLLLTGPNMAGKSTYARAVALCVLLAQIGSFVPASFARIGLADAIFSRIGASDDLAAGESTFMREMVETSRILRQATERSLVVVDEIGRGTSTYDGLAIAWAVAEDLILRIRARTVFTTHYQELTSLEGRLPGVQNLTMAVEERPESGEIVFLHHVRPGAADRSYGVHVAALAGLPEAVLARAREVLASLETGGQGRAWPASTAPGDVPAPVAAAAEAAQADHPGAPAAASQLSLFGSVGAERRAAHPLERLLRALDPDGLTPREALNLLYEWKRRFGREERP
ncbi:MAG: DNA mismatch repair protein MutS [Clostridia bacterium]|nr:DNA mismatch repair protein MutS [Clostridia bacterium]